MTTVFVISDTHFGHANILNFKLDDGTAMRPFQTVEEMDEHMIERWNAVVRPQDHVYHLGDFCMKKDFVMWYLPRLNGHKRLVRGNHDIFPTKYYLQWGFDEIYGVRVLDGLIFSHIPLHPDSLKHQWVNVHGHVHNNKPQGFLGPRYYNVCVEMTDYTPITLEDLRERIKKVEG